MFVSSADFGQDTFNFFGENDYVICDESDLVQNKFFIILEVVSKTHFAV